MNNEVAIAHISYQANLTYLFKKRANFKRQILLMIEKQDKILQELLMLSLVLADSTRCPDSWSLAKESQWYERIATVFTDEQWKSNFRITKNSAFPLLPFLQKPYIQRHQMPEYQKHFNSTLSRARVVVENAFGRLKARFRCLQQMDFSIKNTTKIIQACCILNNLCELNSDDVDPTWSVPQALPNQDTEEGDTDEQSVRIREAIANFLAS
ncbi:putative nuclease HARBI1 [Uloborus diversus]|uniref:putative nuclease HARBI1 n=2 Tax=Uloborus diversus TaxID=327109 RepID=UPI002409D1CB|nr:putative nuclease HARBI1 [Uloborus diversus]